MFSISFNMFTTSFQSIDENGFNYVPSTAVDYIITNAIKGRVVVKYADGSVYYYTNVSRRAIFKFNVDAARSMGKFVNTVLKTNSVVSNFVLSGWEAFAAG